MADASEDFAVSTLGPCPTCGSERLFRTAMERTPGVMGFQVVHYADCGKCPTMRITLEPPGDEVTDAAP